MLFPPHLQVDASPTVVRPRARPTSIRVDGAAEVRDFPTDGTEPPAAAPTGVPVLASLLAAIAVAVFSFAGVILLVATRPSPAEEPSPEATVAATPAFREAGASPRPPAESARSIRVISTGGRAEPQSAGNYRVTFIWALDGANEGDPAVIRLYLGERPTSEVRGVLGANTFDVASGTLTLIVTQECATDGWSAELVSIRSQRPAGDGMARVRGVTCR